MAIQDIVVELVGQVAKNPDILTNLLAHPYSTIGNMTGNNNVSKEEASQVVTATSALASGKTVDFGNLASMAAGFLAKNGNSVHALANSLLGNGASQGVDVSNGVTGGIMDNLVGAVSKGGLPGVDLSDGIGLDDLAGLAGAFFGGKK